MTEKSEVKAVKATKKTAKKTTTVKYVKVYNNMRCPWMVHFNLLNEGLLTKKGDAPLKAASHLYSKDKNLVMPGMSVTLRKDVFENHIKNKDTGVIDRALTAMIAGRNLIVADVKESVDLRDTADLDTKRTPDPLVDGKGKKSDVLLTEPLTLDVVKKGTVTVEVK